MAGAVAPAMGWTLANHALTTREARRIFGVIGAGSILGAPCAGFLTVALTHRHVRPETLLLGIALGLGLCGLSVRLLFRQTQHRLADLSRNSSADRGVPKNLLQVWSHIQASRYLLLITVLIMVGCAATTIIGYQFKLIAYKSFNGDKVALAAFFGRFNGYVGLASFVLQMLVTGRLLRSFGIRVTLFVTPIVFLGGSMAVWLAPVLLSACILKGSQGLLRYSLDKSTTELLYLPVAPPRVKNQIKSFIDGFVYRLADGFAGIALLIFATRMKFSPGRITLVNFVFLFAWIGIAYGVRREYLRVLRRAIERRTLDPEGTAAGVVDSTTAEVLAQSLERSGEQQVLYGLSLFEVGREPIWHPVLGRLLEHPSSVVRQRALHLLAYGGHREVIPQVERMLGDEAIEVRAEALQYLVVHAHKDPLDLLRSSSDVPTHCLQSAVIIYLARSQDSDNVAAARLILSAMLSDTGPEAVATQREAARALGAIPTPSEMHVELLGLLGDDNHEVAQQALLSAGRIQAGECLQLVVESLGDPRLLGAARAALAHYGEKAVAELQDRLNDGATRASVRKQVPKVLARMGTSASVAALAKCLVQSDPEIRYEVIKALNKIRARDAALLPSGIEIPYMLDFELIGYYRSFQMLFVLDNHSGTHVFPVKSEPLIVTAMRERMEQEFERVFRLMGLLYPPGDIHNAYAGLTSHRPQLQANALEVLEHILTPDLYRRLVAGVDSDRTSAERLEFARRLCQTSVSSRAEALRISLQSGDRWLCACALYEIGHDRLTELDHDLQQMTQEDPLLGEAWKWASDRLAGAEVAKGETMLTVIEKVDLLRRAAIFQATPAQSLVRVASVTSELYLPPEQMLYQQDSPADAMFFLLVGEVEFFRSGSVAQRKGKHQMIGTLAALASGTYMESAVTTQPTRVLRIDQEDFFDALAEDSGVTRGILKVLAGMAVEVPS